MYNKNLFYCLGGLFFLFFFYSLFFSIPKYFPVDVVFKVEQGDTLRSISLHLKEAHVIRSRLAFESFVILYGGEKHLVFADYLFDEKLPVWKIARRISRGERNLAPVVVTIPEGFDAKQIADLFVSKLDNFDKSQFLLKAEEGYLFPDTYFFFTTANEDDVLKSFNDNFNKKITPFLGEFIKIENTTGRSEQDIITMASIIEREGKGDTDREVISGILWKRIKLGIALQVDAAPETYKTKGLPKNPIANPGLEAIKAALYPQNSPYLYYLHDKNGEIHYAKTFAEHRQNIVKYLK
ncbi:MAG: endolytic transglycosylase MltG [Candidatus Parcubacteria bacterium]|nr:endolytic transglycosylase MltG [Candidatus Parcubacteria bacterium]